MPGNPGREFLHALHGLRGVLALWVLVFHVSPTVPGVSHGKLTIDVFFVLSGYVLMHSHARDLVNVSWLGSVEFLRRRFWRTIPLHVACVLLAAATYFLLRSSLPSAKAFVQSLLLLEGWAAPGIGVNIPIWSLGVEWLGYLAFPLIVVAVMRVQSAPILITAMVTIFTIEVVTLWLIATRSWPLQGLDPVIRMAGGFLNGCLLWRLHQALPAITQRSDIVMAAAVAGAAATLSTVSFPDVAIGFLAVVVHAAARPGRLVRTILGHPVPIFIGRISFSLYLSHFLILMIALRLQGPDASALARALASITVYAVAFLVAIALCFLVEEPGRRWASKLMPRLVRAV